MLIFTINYTCKHNKYKTFFYLLSHANKLSIIKKKIFCIMYIKNGNEYINITLFLSDKSIHNQKSKKNY